MAGFANAANKIIYAGMGLGALGAVASEVMYDVNGGQRAVMFTKMGPGAGVQDDVRGEGTHFKIPYLQEPVIYDVKMQAHLVPVVTPSRAFKTPKRTSPLSQNLLDDSDLQNVQITLRVLYRPVIPKLPEIHMTLGPGYADSVLPSISNEVLKAVVAQYDAEQLITQRENVSMKVRQMLLDRATVFNIELDDVALTQLTFSREFNSAVEAKQVAQQQAEMSRYVVEQAEQEKLATVIRAEGDAIAADLISEALRVSGKGVIELRKIDTAKDVARIMSRSRNVAYLPGGKNMLLNMGV